MKNHKTKQTIEQHLSWSNLRLLVKKYWLLVAVIALATWLRFWALESHAIFFSDAGYDLLQARQAIIERTVPLLGIPSSVPRFRQGPVTVWLEMLIWLVVGDRLWFFSMIFAGLGMVAVIAAYEFAATYLQKSAKWLTVFLIAASPLAVAQSRMVYHTNPIPMALLLYLWSLMRLWQQTKYGLFWAVLSFCFLFQFELATFPLALLIPFVLWRTKQPLTKKHLNLATSATLLGLFPQILHDITNRFAHIGGFLAWVAYRILSGFGGEHTFDLDHLNNGLRSIWLYGGRIFTVDIVAIKALSFIVIIWSLWRAFELFRRKSLSPALEIISVGTCILLLAYLVHGGPSEAYYPPFIVLFPLLIAGAVSSYRGFIKRLGLFLSLVLFIINVIHIPTTSFFTGEKNGFSYGPSVSEMKSVLNFIAQRSNQNFTLRTTDPYGKFPSYFDNYRFLGLSMGLLERSDGRVFFIENRPSDLENYPNTIKAVFPSVDVYSPL